eukprot:COSAG02_NODE_21739_length_777_cov_0.576696_1_plen_147_part_00
MNTGRRAYYTSFCDLPTVPHSSILAVPPVRSVPRSATRVHVCRYALLAVHSRIVYDHSMNSRSTTVTSTRSRPNVYTVYTRDSSSIRMLIYYSTVLFIVRECAIQAATNSNQCPQCRAPVERVTCMTFDQPHVPTAERDRARAPVF